MGKTKPKDMYNWVRNRFEIMHIEVGHIQKKVCAPLSKSFGLSFLTQKNLGGLRREEVSKMAKNVKNGPNKAEKTMQQNSKKIQTETYLSRVTLK